MWTAVLNFILMKYFWELDYLYSVIPFRKIIDYQKIEVCILHSSEKVEIKFTLKILTLGMNNN